MPMLSIWIMGCIGIVVLNVLVHLMGAGSLIMWVMSLWRWRLSDSLIGGVLLHFHLETHLVFGSHTFITLLGIRCQSPPTFSKDTSHFNKLNSREFLHNLRTHLVGEEYIRSTSTLGCSGIFWSTLITFTRTMILNHDSASIMSRRRHIRGNFCVVATFVLSCPGIPGSFLLGSKILVHVTGILGKLSKGHAWILALELFTHGVLVQKIGRHVALRGIRILFRFALASFSTWRSNNRITLGIITGGWYVRS
mmetsp:Transcript_14998/g.19709  ORF Transcript_14998/g.19709 Transcript_14998/m.19709 type:complete len:251 (+) Transcript_14998:260-1012(+)